jgi:hypothetical protein
MQQVGVCLALDFRNLMFSRIKLPNAFHVSFLAHLDEFFSLIL